MFDIDKVRSDFPILKRQINGKPLVFLDSGATSQKPESVLNTLDDYYRNHNANIHRGVYQLSVESTKMVDEAREKVAKFVGGAVEEIVFVRNTSEAMNLVAYSWGQANLKPGDAILTSVLEHHSDLVPWQELAKRNNLELRVVEMSEDGDVLWYGGEVKSWEKDGLKIKTGSLSDLMNTSVKLVSFSGQSNVLGLIVDIKRLVGVVRKKNPLAKIMIDGAQLVPHRSVDVVDLGIDFLAFSAHKMLGPTGVGVLWGRKELLSDMNPFLYGGDMIADVSVDGAVWADIPHKFEAGTPDIAGIIATGAAVDYLTDLGMENVESYEEELTRYALEKFAVLESEGLVELYGPKEPELKGAVIPFNVVGVHAHDVAQVLDGYGIAVRSGQHCAAPLIKSYGQMAMVRASMYIYNTKEEIDFLVEKLREVPKVFE
jgi:cysteine desulfurase / selenocysteine lyase